MPACDDGAGARDAHGAAALELDRVAAGLLDEAEGGLHRLLVGDLVGAEGQVADQERGAQPAAGGPRQHEHLVELDADGARIAEHGHGAGVADQDEVDAGRLGGAGAREVVGGDHDDRLAEALLLEQPRQGHRQARGVGRGWMFGCALMATQPPGCPLALRMVLSMRRVCRRWRRRRRGPRRRRARRARGRRGGRTRGSRARRRARASRPARPRAATPASRSPALSDASAAARRRAARARARGRRRAGGRCGSTAPGRRPRARSGTTSMRTGQVEVADQRADDERLLRVLLAEEGHVGADHVQQLGTTVVTPSKCSRRGARPRASRSRPLTCTVVPNPGG